jgi:hypothetical protein
LGIKNKDIIFLSNLDIEDGLERTERVIRICKATGITDWIEGKLGETKSLFDVKKINERGISVEFHEYQHPEYTQLFGDFIPYLSVVDLILNHGPDSLSIIRSGRKF